MNEPSLLSATRDTWQRAFSRHLRLLTLAVTAGLTVLGLASPPSRLQTASPTRVLVRVKAGADLNQIHRRLGTHGRKILTRRSAADALDLQTVEFAAGRREEVLAALRASGAVEYAEPDYPLRVLQEPNDPRFRDGSLWHLKNTGTANADIDASSAWDLRTSAAGVVVAVIDTGVRITHEDLRGNLWHNPGETGYDANGRSKHNNGIDDDGNGYVDDFNGIDAQAHTGNPYDDYGHGTHVAGIIAATGNNAVGVTGVAWRAQIMALKALDQDGEGTVSQAVECINYARQHGARIVNASWGSAVYNSQALRDAINGLRTDGILFVAACGNDGTDNDATPLYPASFPLDNILAVAATTRTDTRAAFSNWGRTTVDLAAPGNGIYSTWAGFDNDYATLSGTSQAAPQVAGAAALIWAQNPALTYRQVSAFILNNTDTIPDFANKSVTGGRLNLARALADTVLHSPPQDITPPVVAMSLPRLEATVRGSAVTVSATAADSVGVVGVQFTLDGAPLGPERTSMPYTYTWDSRTVANGRHVIGARARDAAGNVTTALAGVVKVAN